MHREKRGPRTKDSRLEPSISRSKNAYLVWRRLEFDASDLGDFLGDLDVEAALSVQALHM
jgi:hypothetical protein